MPRWVAHSDARIAANRAWWQSHLAGVAVMQDGLSDLERRQRIEVRKCTDRAFWAALETEMEFRARAEWHMHL